MEDNISYINHLQNKIIKNLVNKLEEYFIEGLKLKGFEFETKHELEGFIKTRCRCEDTPHINQRVYFVDDVPFFLHNYEVQFNNDFTFEDRSTTMTANYGTYAFL